MIIMALEDSVSSAGNLIIFGILSVVGFFLMLAFLTQIPPAMPTGNPYNGWISIIIIVAYMLWLYIGYRKAKDGSLIRGLFNK